MSTPDEVKLVLERLQTMPRDMAISIGGSEPLTRDDMAKHIEMGDDTGKLLVEVYMDYLRSFKG